MSKWSMVRKYKFTVGCPTEFHSASPPTSLNLTNRRGCRKELGMTITYFRNVFNGIGKPAFLNHTTTAAQAVVHCPQAVIYHRAAG